MTDSAPSTTSGGRTRWRRFGAVFTPVMALVGLFLALMVTGAIAAPLVVSGQEFIVEADSLSIPASARGNEAFVQYGTVDLVDGSPTMVAVTELKGAVIENLVQTACAHIPGTPFNGTIVIEADTATATNMVVDATELTGDAEFTNIEIGVVVDGRDGDTAGQTADNVEITNLNQTALYISAATFVLDNLGLGASLSTSACP